MQPCRVYMVSTVQTSFWGSQKRQYETYYIPEMEKLAERFGFQLTSQKEIITTLAEAEAAGRKIRESGCDFLLIQVSTFADGNLILPLAEAGVRLGLWAVPEITSSGAIPTTPSAASTCTAASFTNILTVLSRTNGFSGM